MKLKSIAIGMLVALLSSCTPRAHTFTAGEGTFLLDGEPIVVKAAELHYPRIPRQYWEHRIRMCKALGMNTICIYVFWNIHEQAEGKFDFTGNLDVSEFCRIARKLGMYVIVRPGPYVCAEWEMGGLPWWLLRKKDIQLRDLDPYFMQRVKIFEEKVGEQLKPLTIQNGGSIIMVQVENEYGSYGENKPYVAEIRDCLRSIYGDEMTLFQCDWASNFEKNGLDDLTWTMNFGTGSDIDQQFRRLGELRPDAPRMCSEFWSGWFDKWGARHETRPARDMVAGIDEMLSKGISFSLYMTHGGTSFGHWAGANSPGFAPDVTSYDYDAPINESGQPTEKYWELRKTMEKYNGGQPMPDVPEPPMPVIDVPQFELGEFVPLAYGCSEAGAPDDPSDLTFESHGLGWGSMYYATELPELQQPSRLTLDVHDYAQVFINDRFIGKIDRVKNEKSITLPPAAKGDKLQILVEAMGRINFGRAIKDYKGIVGDVRIETETDGQQASYTLRDWKKWCIPDDYSVAARALDNQAASKDGNDPRNTLQQECKTWGTRGYYRGHFSLTKVGDTFLNCEKWGKGEVYVNGHAMGRFWSIGPQQTLYVPGCWLRKGQNEIVVLDIVGPRETVTWGQAEPELNKLQLEKSGKHNSIGDKPDLNSAIPVATGNFKPGSTWQTVNFPATATGRFLAIECRSTQKADDFVAIAELYLKNPAGKRISRETWTTKYADSEAESGNHTGDKVFDLQESTYWQTEKDLPCPHLLVIDLGSTQEISALEYLPRQEQGNPGSVKEYRIYIADFKELNP